MTADMRRSLTVQRIPNPGSDLDIFVRIFRDLHALLHDRVDFGLDDMTAAMIERNNVSSQGAFGSEALQRSTRDDRSRDPLYNQSKMYAELHRTLGWIQSTSSALRFAFSWLGDHVASAKEPKILVVECLLGIAYPNAVLGVQGEQSLRIFTSILRAMEALDGGLTRDEMIVGPLSIDDDRNPDIWAPMVEKLHHCRDNKGATTMEIRRLETSLRITHTTMGNYTRFPIAAIQWAGWAEKSSRSMLTLTGVGRTKLAELQRMVDIRLSDYRALPDAAKHSFIRLSTHRMLERSGFDISLVADSMDDDRSTLTRLGAMPAGDILFSPFQQIARNEVSAAFPHLSEIEHPSDPSGKVFEPVTARGISRAVPASRLCFDLAGEISIPDGETESLARELREAFDRSGKRMTMAVNAYAARHASDNQDVFYPLVAALFRLLGFDCRISRRGVNYARADAMIVDPEESIPIEIKSPGEESEISVKGVRQAVENKIVLLSRKSHPCKSDTTSLLVGFNLPNERSEVRELIDNYYSAFNFRIGVVDFRSLVHLAMLAVVSGRQVVLRDFRAMKGIIHVDHTTTKE